MTKILTLSNISKLFRYVFGFASKQAAKAQAPTPVDIDTALRNGTVYITAKKKDGTITTRVATRSFQLIPEDLQPKTQSGSPSHLLTFFDVEKQSWRSFIRQNIIDWELQ